MRSSAPLPSHTYTPKMASAAWGWGAYLERCGTPVRRGFLSFANSTTLLLFCTGRVPRFEQLFNLRRCVFGYLLRRIATPVPSGRRCTGETGSMRDADVCPSRHNHFSGSAPPLHVKMPPFARRPTHRRPMPALRELRAESWGGNDKSRLEGRRRRVGCPNGCVVTCSCTSRGSRNKLNHSGESQEIYAQETISSGSSRSLRQGIARTVPRP